MSCSWLSAAVVILMASSRCRTLAMPPLYVAVAARPAAARAAVTAVRAPGDAPVHSAYQAVIATFRQRERSKHDGEGAALGPGDRRQPRDRPRGGRGVPRGRRQGGRDDAQRR